MRIRCADEEATEVLSGSGRPCASLSLRRIVKVGGVHLLDNPREETEQKCLDRDSGDLAGIRWSRRYCGSFALETLPPRQLRGCRPLTARGGVGVPGRRERSPGPPLTLGGVSGVAAQTGACRPAVRHLPAARHPGHLGGVKESPSWERCNSTGAACRFCFETRRAAHAPSQLGAGEARGRVLRILQPLHAESL